MCWTLIGECLNSKATDSLLAVLRRGTYPNVKGSDPEGDRADKDKAGYFKSSNVTSYHIMFRTFPTTGLPLQWGKKKKSLFLTTLSCSFTFNLKYVNDVLTTMDKEQ